MLSPGLEDNCASNERNRLPNCSSLNSQSAASWSTHALDNFASATRVCRRFRTGLFGIEHRVKMAHGSSVSHHQELLARIICKSLKIIRKLWVIERFLLPLRGCSDTRRAGRSVAPTLHAAG